MTKNELGNILNKKYFNSKQGETVVMIHLFGIEYANDIKKSGATCREIAKLAQIRPSYATEISKGVKLAKYVKVVHHA
jgi:5-methylcytosine-specific restriction protein B